MGEKLKSALELAMEKYGISSDTDKNLTPEQKEKIAEIRSFYKSKKAELEILQKQNLGGIQSKDPREYQTHRDKAEEEYLRDRGRLESEEERKIQEIRKQG